jgi:hypothetical protein
MTSACKGGGKFVSKWSVSVSQHYPMPSLPLVTTGKTIWQSL